MVVASTGSVRGSGAEHVFPFAPTRTLSIVVLSAESVYVMEGVHWLATCLVDEFFGQGLL